MLIDKNIIEGSAKYISQQQKKDGGFISFSSIKRDDFTDSISVQYKFYHGSYFGSTF